ncbi:MAG: RluA family pseudouridine synthase, partial [Deltaproteobacteria bacterium]|nr:RluA family pseudouridine synthase [Deltaproteobacteria bacterium]
THQIRVHCAAIRHPIVGDFVYGGSTARKRVAYENDPLSAAPRQMLHAWRLGFVHPETESFVFFEAPVPQDFEAFIEALHQT